MNYWLDSLARPFLDTAIIESRRGREEGEEEGGKSDGRGRGEEEKKEAYLLLVQNVYSGPQTVAVVA